MELLGIHGPFLGGVKNHEVDRIGIVHMTEIKQPVDAFTLRSPGFGGVGHLLPRNHTIRVFTGRRGFRIVFDQRSHIGRCMAHEFGRPHGHELNQTLIRDEAAVHQHLVAHAVRAFKADDAIGRFKESEFLLFQCMRRMIGGQQVNRAVRDGRDGGLAIRFRAQRRVHLGQRAVLEQRLIAQCQIMRRGFASDRQSFSLGLTNSFKRNRGAHMLEVHVDTGAAGRFDVASHDLEFGVFRNAGYAKFAGNRSLVDGTRIVMLAMFNQIQIGSLDVLQHLIQNLRGHGGTVIAYCGDRVGQHGWCLGVVLKAGHILQPIGNIACLVTGTILGRAHAQVVTDRQLHIMRGIVLLQEVDDVVEAGVQNFLRAGSGSISNGLAVQCRQRVRHDEYVRVSAGRRSTATGDHRFLVCLAGVAEVDVWILESGSQGQTGGIDVGAINHGGSVGEVGSSGPGHHEVNDLAGVPDLDVA